MKRIYITLFMLAALICISCSGGEDENDVPKKETPEIPTDTDEIDYSKVKIEYDDGKNIIFHVKLAIDKEGLEMRNGDLEYFKVRLKAQWQQINERFNGLDKKKALKRNYIFVPDLDDILVYEYENSNSHWTVPEKFYAQRKLDLTKYQCMVVYDFVVQEGEGGGGFGDYDGMGNILVINAGTSNIGKFYDHFSTSANTAAAITHELGHFRGNVDIYTHVVSKSNNPISNEAFTPTAGNMNNPYPALENCAWSDYEIQVINLTGAKKEFRIIYKCMNNYFADNIEVTITEKGQDVSGYTLNFYKVKRENGTCSVTSDISLTQSADGNTARVDAYNLFWTGYDYNYREKYPWTYQDLFLMEVINRKTGNKAYKFITNYEVHSQGIKDKGEDKISGKSIYRIAIDIK